MRRIVLFFLAACMIASGISVIFFAKNYFADNREYKSLAKAYEARGAEYSTAFRQYSRALSKVTKRRPETLYNFANITFREALRQKDASYLRSVIEYYKEVLRINPNFFRAKRNLEIVSLFLSRIEKEGKRRGENQLEGEGEDELKRKEKKLQPGLTPYEPTRP